jgi:hypothetical protein
VLDSSPKQFIDIRVGSLQCRSLNQFTVRNSGRTATVRESVQRSGGRYADVSFELGPAVLSRARVDCAGNSGNRKLYRLSNPFRPGRER